MARNFDPVAAFEVFQMIQAVDNLSGETLAHTIAVDYMVELNEVREGRRKDRTYPTYIRPIDRIMTGFKPTEFILLGGRPAMGKTLLGLQLALNQALAGNPVVFFTMEMSSDQLMSRLIANLASVEGEAFLDPMNRINLERFTDMGIKIERLKHIPLHIVDLNQANTERLEGEIAKMKIKHGVVGFYLDYLQLMECSKSDKAKPKIEQMTNISKQLKAICKRQKVFGVVISSLSRATEGRADHRPILSDLRETGQLEFDADKVAFVYRPAEHDKEANKQLMEVIVRKNRNGSLGKAEIKCELEYTRASEFQL
jgi:replicative DNA helicase